MFEPFRRQASSRRGIRLGYVALVDCAPLAVARELGLFERHGLNVHLSRELGWASVRDGIYHGELDAAQTISGIALGLGLGASGLRRRIAVPLVLNLHGNAITLSKNLDFSLQERGALKQHLRDEWKKDRPLTLAASHRYSSHHLLLRQWLRMEAISEPGDVEIVFLPPPLMTSHLRADHIDGYCVGEPWNSEAVLSGAGWCPATSTDLSLGHPEKVLVVSDRFIEEYREEAVRLVAVLLESCEKCQSPEFRSDLIDILALPQYTGCSREVLSNSLGGKFNAGNRFLKAESFHVFHGHGVNNPSLDKASWMLSGLRQCGVIPEKVKISLSQIYREDLYQQAIGEAV